MGVQYGVCIPTPVAVSFVFCSKEHADEILCYDATGNVDVEKTQVKIAGGKNGK